MILLSPCLCEFLEGHNGMAERVGFEPTRPFWGLTVFKTAAFNRSATPPFFGILTLTLMSRGGQGRAIRAATQV
jgi:hypothetical protein